MSELEELKNRYNRKKADIAHIKAEAEQLLEELRSKCDHSGIIYFCDYKPSGILFGAQSPRLMCAICGHEEEEWNNMNGVLPKSYGAGVKLRMVTLSRDDFFKQRI